VTFLLFTLICLAAFRITWFLIDDDFLDPIRDRIVLRWQRHDSPRYAAALTCPWCLGFYVSAALVAGVAAIASIPLPGIYALAVSTVVGILGEVVSWLRSGDAND